MLPEGRLSKAQKEQILRAHMSKGGVNEKTRILKDFTKTQRRALMEGWVVGKLPDKEIIGIIQKFKTKNKKIQSKALKTIRDIESKLKAGKAIGRSIHKVNGYNSVRAKELDGGNWRYIFDGDEFVGIAEHGRGPGGYIWYPPSLP